MSSRITYVYMVTVGRSGSTLLAFLLATHPELTSIGELPVMVDSRLGKKCSCGELMSECGFWTGIERRLREQDKAYLYNRQVRELPLNNLRWRLFSYALPPGLEQARELLRPLAVPNREPELARVDLAVDVARAACAEGGTSIFVDSSKNHYFLRTLARHRDRYPDIDLKVLHTVRDPRGVAASSTRSNPGMTAARVAKVWNRFNRAVERIERNYLKPGELHLLNYSALCSDPEGELNKVADFLGIERRFQTRQIDNRDYHIRGNNIRYSPIDSVREDLRWASELSESDQRDVVRRARSRMLRYGML